MEWNDISYDVTKKMRSVISYQLSCYIIWHTLYYILRWYSIVWRTFWLVRLDVVSLHSNLISIIRWIRCDVLLSFLFGFQVPVSNMCDTEQFLCLEVLWYQFGQRNFLFGTPTFSTISRLLFEWWLLTWWSDPKTSTREQRFTYNKVSPLGFYSHTWSVLVFLVQGGYQEFSYSSTDSITLCLPRLLLWGRTTSILAPELD